MDNVIEGGLKRGERVGFLGELGDEVDEWWGGGFMKWIMNEN